MAERTTQYRLPNVKWGEYTTKQPRTRKAVPDPAASIGAQQPDSTTIEGLPAQPRIVGPHFGIRGPGKYYNPRNVSGQQFNKPAIKQGLTDLSRLHTRSQYFRHAGFTAALRYTLGIEQVPSHVSDYLNADRRQTGLNPRSRRWVSEVVHPERELDEW
jgi:hypothetical protein